MKKVLAKVFVCVLFVCAFFGAVTAKAYLDEVKAEEVANDKAQIRCLTYEEDMAQKRAAHEAAYCEAALETLHKVYQEHPEVWAEIQESAEYAKMDSINGGDWEDFYEEW